MTSSSPTSPSRPRGADAAQRASDRKLIAFCEGWPGRSRAQGDPGPARGGPLPETIAAILGHLYIHQIHHRGQVHAMLSGTSVAPPQLDEFFLDQDLHLRRDELRALALPET